MITILYSCLSISDTVYNATYVDYISNKIGQIQSNINIRPYVTSFKVPEEYTNAIYDVHSSLYTTISDFVDRSQAKHLKKGLNEMYQQVCFSSIL